MRLVFVALLLSWFWSCLVCMMDWKWLESWGYVAGCSLTSHLTSKIQASNLATIQKGLYIYIGFRGSAVFVVTARLQCLPCLSRDLHMQDLISKAWSFEHFFIFGRIIYYFILYFPSQPFRNQRANALSTSPTATQVHCTRLQRFLVWQLASWGWLETWISTMITSSLSNTLRTRAEQHVTFERWFPDRMRVIQ